MHKPPAQDQKRCGAAGLASLLGAQLAPDLDASDPVSTRRPLAGFFSELDLVVPYTEASSPPAAPRRIRRCQRASPAGAGVRYRLVEAEEVVRIVCGFDA